MTSNTPDASANHLTAYLDALAAARRHATALGLGTETTSTKLIMRASMLKTGIKPAVPRCRATNDMFAQLTATNDNGGPS